LATVLPKTKRIANSGYFQIEFLSLQMWSR